MGLSYIVLGVPMGELGTREFPFIYSDLIPHAVMYEHMHKLLLEQFLVDPQLLSAGQCNLFDGIECTGKSLSLSIESREDDSEMIRMYNYFHGVS